MAAEDGEEESERRMERLEGGEEKRIRILFSSPHTPPGN